METLVIVAHSHHKNPYYGKVKPHAPARFTSRGTNCRAFQSSHGILPSPFKPSPNFVSKQTQASKTPSPTRKPPSNSHSVDNTSFKQPSRSAPIPINVKTVPKESPFEDDLSFSELWAGPAYSNSPPPSSLPIPKFSMRPKRTVSLDLPVSDSDIPVHPIAKSAPASPSREYNSSTRGIFQSADSATKTLRRILNLDVLDE